MTQPNIGEQINSSNKNQVSDFLVCVWGSGGGHGGGSEYRGTFGSFLPQQRDSTCNCDCEYVTVRYCPNPFISKLKTVNFTVHRYTLLMLGRRPERPQAREHMPGMQEADF